MSTLMPVHVWTWPAALVRVVDGDTADFLLDTGFRTRRSPERVRLLGVNTPEVVGATKAAGLASKQFTTDWLREAETIGVVWPLLIQTFRPTEHDAFGRWLAMVWRIDTGACLNENLLESGMAVPFDR